MSEEHGMKGPEHDRTGSRGEREAKTGPEAPSSHPGPIRPADASELFQTAFRASPDSVNINRCDDGMYVDANEGFAAITGWTREEVVGRTSLEIDVWADPEDRARMVEFLDRDGRVDNMEARFRMRDGRLRWGLMSARILPIDGVPHILSITRDITDRREAEERFRESQSRLNAVVSAAPLVLWALDRDGRFTLSEGLGLETIGLEPGEAVGRSVYELYEAYPHVLADVRAALQGKGVTASHQVADRVFQSRLIPTFSDDGAVTGLLGVSVDVTQEAQLQAQLVQAQKLEAVGRLAGGVAHDFNNLLTAIQGYGELLAERLRKPLPDEPEALVEIQQDLEEIRRAAERASALTIQLLAFSRKQVLEKKVLDLNHQVTQVERMLGRLIGEDIVLTTELAPDLNHVEGDASQLEQVIVNLAVNARDAMPRGGRLALSTRNREISEPISGEYGEIPPGSYVVLSVADSGTGILPEDRSHIFEPFFTTKAQGKGTGLGLPTVFGIVKQSGGHVQVDSEVGRGTLFSLWLPSTTEAVPEDPVRDGPEAALGEETILLVEDEDAVRGLVAQVLTGCGYHVLEAAGAHGAVALSREWKGPIHLIVTDVVMPEMGGRDLVALLSEERPGLPALFISGYGSQEDVPEDFPGPGQDFLPKPFSPGVLTQKVRHILDSWTDSETPD